MAASIGHSLPKKLEICETTFLELTAQGMRPTAIAKELQVSCMTVWRTLEAANEAARLVAEIQMGG